MRTGHSSQLQTFRGCLFGPSCALFSLLVVGCASTHTAKVDDVQSPYQTKGRIQWNSSNLKALLHIDKAAVDRTEDGLLRVRLIIRNKTKRDLFVDVRTVFTDEQGFPKEQTNWEPLCCTARTQSTYETVSLGTQVSDYQVVIRDPKKALK